MARKKEKPNLKKHHTLKLMTITPDLARKWLSTKLENRTISLGDVTALAEAMRRGVFFTTNNCIAFDEDGHLSDGEHRLRACVLSGCTIVQWVMWGMTKRERDSIDKNRPRSLAQQQAMDGKPNAGRCLSYVRLCAQILSGQHVMLKDAGLADEWERMFQPGIDWVVEFLAGTASLRMAGIAGALAFAHKADPRAIEDFTKKIRDGEGIVKGDPAQAFFRWHRRFQDDKNRKVSGSQRTLIYRRVLRCAMAAVEGEQLSKIQDTDEGVRYFRQFYSGRKATALCKPWQEAMQLRFKEIP